MARVPHESLETEWIRVLAQLDMVALFNDARPREPFVTLCHQSQTAVHEHGQLMSGILNMQFMVHDSDVCSGMLCLFPCNKTTCCFRPYFKASLV